MKRKKMAMRATGMVMKVMAMSMMRTANMGMVKKKMITAMSMMRAASMAMVMKRKKMAMVMEVTGMSMMRAANMAMARSEVARLSIASILGRSPSCNATFLSQVNRNPGLATHPGPASKILAGGAAPQTP